MDWERFYRERDYDRMAYLAGERMPDFLERFFERVGTPATMLSVGCGPAVTELAVAARYPALRVHAVDLSPEVVADNREVAAREGVENVTFAVDALPDLETAGTYDLVYCVATLFFVPAVEAALDALWERVAPGGHLVVTYGDEGTREWVRTQEDWRQAFFPNVLDGSALREREEVAATLGVEVRDYWTMVGGDEERHARSAPTVVAEKPA